MRKVAFGNCLLALLMVAPAISAQERSGEQIVREQCSKCHQTGTSGAPRIGDRATNIAEDIVYLVTGDVEDLNP